jgi:hypothetical protein
MRARVVFLIPGAAAFALASCKDLTGRQSLPAGVNDPSSFNTASGARGMRNAADSVFERALLQYVIDAGLLTDELQDANTGADLGSLPSTTVSDPLDERILTAASIRGTSLGGSVSYENLQGVRGAAAQAIGALAAYDTAGSSALRGEMYALQGYAEIYLADLFCSGIPLSTLDFQGDFTYKPGSSCDAVYQDAIAKLDTAVALSADSARILNLARVGLGRAYLALGQYARASQAVADVPDGFQYQAAIQWGTASSTTNVLNQVATVSDGEGFTGLPFVSSGDPRTRDTASVTTTTGLQLYFPQKYRDGLTGGAYTPITVADWIEVRLIRAEAALAAGDPVTWLSQLNYLRQHATVAGQDDTPLPTVSDPGIDSARVSLLFDERGYWLYLTGHRQGDLRRLIRQYHRAQDDVYPTGDYFAPGRGVYGSDVTAPIPSSETPNPYFHGCLDRNA